MKRGRGLGGVQDASGLGPLTATRPTVQIAAVALWTTTKCGLRLVGPVDTWFIARMSVIRSLR
jgi:hypothetical protein